MPADQNSQQLNRRQFLTRGAKAGISIAAACALGYSFYDSEGPDPLLLSKDGILFPDFTVSDSPKKMSIVRGKDRTQTLQLALKAIGGIERIIQRGDRVLLKVNAAFASPPLLSATTHPLIVSEMTRQCLQAGASSVAITDNPINDPLSCFELTGIARAAREAGAEVILPRSQYFKSTTIKNARLIRSWPILMTPLNNITKLIGIAPLKDHHRSGASMTMKNWYGLLGGRRNIFHQDIHNIIKELAMMVKPSLVILDGTTAMMHNGPTGGSLSDLEETETMIVGTDQVAVDAYGATLLGKSLDELTHIIKAEEMGVGTSDWKSLNPEELSV